MPTSAERSPELIAFLEDLEITFQGEKRRSWLQKQVVSWLENQPLSIDYLADNADEYIEEPNRPWPPVAVEALSIPEQCAVISAFHDSYFQGPRFFPWPENMSDASWEEFRQLPSESVEEDFRRAQLQSSIWILFRMEVSSSHPERYLIELRAMLRSIESAYVIGTENHQRSARLVKSSYVEEQPSMSRISKYLSMLTDGASDEHLKHVMAVLQDDNLTTDKSLKKIDSLIPIPVSASASQLGLILGVSKTAVMKTNWWAQNRKGKSDEETARRKASHLERSKLIDDRRREPHDGR